MNTFGWVRKAEENPSEAFVRSLPPGPLRAQLAQLHAMFLHAQARATGDTSLNPDHLAGELAVFERSLREIARYTQIIPLGTREREDRLIRGGAKKQFKKKETR